MDHHSTEELFTYGVYTRKSSEYEESQIQSIQRQIDELTDLIDRGGLVLYQEPLKESRSAFHPGREEFAKLVSWTMQGRINAWLCWHANRLSRNAVDAGTIIYLMDQGKLHHVRTRERIYENTPTDKFMLQMEFTMSKKDSDDKSHLVKSGIQRRYRRGFPTGFPPLGYVLEGNGARSGSSFWAIDEDRFQIVRQLFVRFLDGKDSLTSMLKYATDVGLTSVKRRASGGTAISRATIHRILTNPVYAGFFFGTDGRRYSLDSSVRRAITEEEHERINIMLSGKKAWDGKRRSHNAAYRGLIRDTAGRPLGVDRKTQLICPCRHKFAYLRRDACPACGRLVAQLDSPNFLFYTYYYSVRDRKGAGRTARVIEEGKIDEFLIAHVAKRMCIPKPLRDWAVAHLDELADEELRDRRKEARQAAESEKQLAARKRRLRELYMAGGVTEEEYRTDLTRLQAQFAEKTESFQTRDDIIADTKKILNLAVDLENVLKSKSPDLKRQALLDIRSNLVWDGKKLRFCNVKRVNHLLETIKNVEAEKWPFEPRKYVDK